ncbi:hypothetical protein DS745_01325 [Anaerobacillus alkaliphilus]|uniref:YppF-like protein n=1 Tax=Anaerobacillus alkaliphilus TaxID=1548597 RepID=A0A4Q0VY63_9BACI|nr:YppF family protein [Anaerobacillus alkaliphilus]RXJ04058.1 hypothetical protein DS745_01325 [Anaerobacillus alkaliphilus]
MIVKMLIEKYILDKNDKPVNVNQLLDYATLCYVNNQLTIWQYKSLVKELMLRGATKPEFYFEELTPELTLQ